MAFQMHRVQVWSGEISDRAGAAAAKLELLARVGANLEFVFTRPHPKKPETSIIFLAPIAGAEQIQAARVADLAPALDVTMLCVEGDDRPGMGYEIMSRLAVAGINLRGLSLSCVSNRFAAYLAFDNADTATQATQILATLV
jgi:predicted amino acid-binding ACT domain protein